ncbi:MAG: hypothetical protein ACE5GW_01370 [Planctomycetota bacterium]
MAALLSTNLDDPDATPYFLWDEPMSVAELRRRLETASRPERLRLLGKIRRATPMSGASRRPPRWSRSGTI